MSSDARKMAEKALLYNRTHANSPMVRAALVEALEALLAAEPAKGADMSRAEGALAAEVRAALNVADGRWYEWGERAKSVEEILLAGLRGYERAATDDPAPPAGAEVPLPVCMNCSFASGGHVHVNREDGAQAVRYPTAEEWNAAMRAKPAGAEVREAVSAAAELLAAIRYAPTGSIGAIDNTYLPQIGREWLRPIEERIDAGISALAALRATASPAPGSEAVREAAERLETWTDPATGDQYAHGRCVGAPASAGIGEAAKIIRRIVTNHDARITERGVLVYGRPSVSTGFVEAIEWLRRYDAALRSDGR